MTTAGTLDLLLIQPGTGGAAAVGATLAGSEHLGISYLAAAAETYGYRADVIDLEEEKTAPEALVARIVALHPRVIGMSPTSKTAPQAACLSDMLRRRLPETVIVWGGHLATGLAAELFSACPSVDCVALREGELLIPAIIEAGRRKTLPRCPALLTNPLTNFPIDGPAFRQDLDWRTLQPVRHKSAAHYKQYGARILTSVGCKFDCSFCTTPGLFGRDPRQRLPAHVAEEVAALGERYGAYRFWINDDLFCDGSAASQRRALAIVSLMHRTIPELRFRAMLRSDLVARKPEFIRELKANGLEAVFVGLEAGNEHDMRLYRKRLTVAQNSQTSDVLRELGVFLQIGFIMFSPESTVASVIENAEFLRHIRQLYRFMPLSRTVQIFPGTALWNSKIPIEEDRSTMYVKIPKFRDQAVTLLSRAFERLEEEFATSDRAVYQRAHSSLVPDSELHERADRLLMLVRRACVLAQKGSSVDAIVDVGRETIRQLATL